MVSTNVFFPRSKCTATSLIVGCLLVATAPRCGWATEELPVICPAVAEDDDDWADRCPTSDWRSPIELIVWGRAKRLAHGTDHSESVAEITVEGTLYGGLDLKSIQFTDTGCLLADRPTICALGPVMYPGPKGPFYTLKYSVPATDVKFERRLADARLEFNALSSVAVFVGKALTAGDGFRNSVRVERVLHGRDLKPGQDITVGIQLEMRSGPPRLRSNSEIYFIGSIERDLETKKPYYLLKSWLPAIKESQVVASLERRAKCPVVDRIENGIAGKFLEVTFPGTVEEAIDSMGSQRAPLVTLGRRLLELNKAEAIPLSIAAIRQDLLRAPGGAGKQNFTRLRNLIRLLGSSEETKPGGTIDAFINEVIGQTSSGGAAPVRPKRMSFDSYYTYEEDHTDTNHALAWLLCALDRRDAVERHGQRLIEMRNKLRGAWRPEIQLALDAAQIEEQMEIIAAMDRMKDIKPARNAGPPALHQCMTLAFSPDGKLLATAREGEIKIWDTGDWSLKSTLKPPGWIDRLAFSPDQKYLYVASHVTTRVVIPLLARYNLETNEQDRTFKGHKESIGGLWISPDGKQMVTSSYHDQTILLWEIATGCPVRSFDLDQYCDVLDVSPDFTWLARRSDGKGIILSDLQGWIPDRSMFLQGGAGMLRFVPGTTKVIAAGSKYIPGRPATHVSVLDFEANEFVAEGDISQDNAGSMAISADGRYLALGSSGGHVTISSVSSLKEVRRFDWPCPSNDQRSCPSVRFSPDGRVLACSMAFLPPRLIDMATLETIKTGGGHNDEIVSVFFVNRGENVRSIGRDESVCLWEASTMRLLKKVQLPDGYTCVEARPSDGAYLICASRDHLDGPFHEPKTATPPVKVVSAATGECVAEIKLPPVHWNGWHRAQWLANGEAVLLDDGKQHRSNYMTGRSLGTRDAPHSSCFVTEDSKSLLVIEGGGKSSTINVQKMNIALARSERVGKADLPRPCGASGLVPDGKHFYMLGHGIYLFDRTTLKLVASREFKDRYVHAITFRVDGRRCAIVTKRSPRRGDDVAQSNLSTETLVSVHETFSGKTLFAIPVSTREVRDVKLSATGDQLAVARDEGVIEVWPLPNSELGATIEASR